MSQSITIPRKKPTLLLRGAILLLIAAGVVAAFLLRQHLEPARLVREIGGAPAAPLIFMLITTGASLVFVPRTLLALAGGLLFGFWQGVLWTMIGSTAGAVLGFAIARYVSAGVVNAETLPLLRPVLSAAERGGWRSMAVIRLLPLPHTPVNYALGITRVELGSYTLGSFLGMVPATIVYAEVGASGQAALTGGHWLTPTLIALAFLAASFFLPRLGFVRRALRLGAD